MSFHSTTDREFFEQTRETSSGMQYFEGDMRLATDRILRVRRIELERLNDGDTVAQLVYKEQSDAAKDEIGELSAAAEDYVEAMHYVFGYFFAALYQEGWEED